MSRQAPAGRRSTAAGWKGGRLHASTVSNLCFALGLAASAFAWVPGGVFGLVVRIHEEHREPEGEEVHEVERDVEPERHVEPERDLACTTNHLMAVGGAADAQPRLGVQCAFSPSGAPPAAVSATVAPTYDGDGVVVDILQALELLGVRLRQVPGGVPER